MTSDWSFDGFGAEFDEHAIRHLPEYETVQRLVAQVGRYALPPNGTVADLGCSTGRAISELAAAFPGRRFNAVGYDADRTMLDRTRERLDGLPAVTGRLEPVDLTDPSTLVHSDADLTLVLWTLQFLPAVCWRPVLEAARDRSTRDGVLLVAAKTRMESTRWQEIADGALVDYKASRGVTPSEILTKARSLRGTMIVAEVDRLVDEIESAGWVDVEILFRWHAWIVIGAHHSTS